MHLRCKLTIDWWPDTFFLYYVQLKNAYAIAKLRKTGYSKQKFYTEAVHLYKEVHFLRYRCVFNCKVITFVSGLHRVISSCILCIYLFLQINTLMANGDKTALRKLVTENTYSVSICSVYFVSSQRECYWNLEHLTFLHKRW